MFSEEIIFCLKRFNNLHISFSEKETLSKALSWCNVCIKSGILAALLCRHTDNHSVPDRRTTDPALNSTKEQGIAISSGIK